LSYTDILFLALIQGLTEFFPVSSSGHLVIFQNLFGFKEPQIFIDLMLHLGTLLSLFVFLRKDLKEIILSFFRFCLRPNQYKSDPNLRLLFALFLGTIPIALMGYFLSGFFESLFGSLRAVGISLCMTGGFLLLTKTAKKRKMNLISHPVIIGLLQGMAIVPGFSRSGFTIGGALLLGWEEDQAARFSFLLSIPAITGASLFHLFRVDAASQDWTLILAGVLMAAVSGYVALKYLTILVKRNKFYYFSFYCFFVGSLTLVLSIFLQ
jgi:undecaprenyl-diphosphatase